MKNNLGVNIKYFRKNKGFTQEELAEEANKNPMNYDIVLKYVQQVRD